MNTFPKFITGFWRLAGWNMRGNDLLSFVKQNLDLGIDWFDHADIYGGYSCEAIFGEALALEPGLRNHFRLITKCGIKLKEGRFPDLRLNYYDTGKEHIIASVEFSLKNLHTDHIDLLLIHRPDPLMDADAVAEAFTELKNSGKVLSFGVSNFTPFQVDLLASRLPFELVANQVEFSVMYVNPAHDGTLDQCQQRRIAPLAWSPLAGGRLFNEQSEQAGRIRETLNTISYELGGASYDQIALAWVMKHPSQVIPVLGSGNIQRIENAVKALDIQLTREQWFMLWVASVGHRVP